MLWKWWVISFWCFGVVSGYLVCYFCGLFLVNMMVVMFYLVNDELCYLVVNCGFLFLLVLFILFFVNEIVKSINVVSGYFFLVEKRCYSVVEMCWFFVYWVLFCVKSLVLVVFVCWWLVWLNVFFVVSDVIVVNFDCCYW